MQSIEDAQVLQNSQLSTWLLRRCNPASVEEEQGEDDGELSIPVQHTTAAHKLLLHMAID
jgi:hypothetical protein